MPLRIDSAVQVLQDFPSNRSCQNLPPQPQQWTLAAAFYEAAEICEEMKFDCTSFPSIQILILPNAANSRSNQISSFSIGFCQLYEGTILKERKGEKADIPKRDLSMGPALPQKVHLAQDIPCPRGMSNGSFVPKVNQICCSAFQMHFHQPG